MNQRKSILNEKDFLEEVSSRYLNVKSPISKWNIDSYISIYKRWIPAGNKGDGLELGCSRGYSTICLAPLLRKLVVIDGSKKLIDQARKKITAPNVEFREGLFEEIDGGEEEYDFIFCSYILEHVLEPNEILAVCHKKLKRNGKLFITVPNARALSRQMALEMGLIGSLYELTENDMVHGHRRTFDLQSLESLLKESSFSIVDIGGTFLKPFADFQLNKMIEAEILGTEQLSGMQKLAEKYPDIAGSIYAILKK